MTISKKQLLINQIITDFELLAEEIDDIHDNALIRLRNKLAELKEMIDSEIEEAERDEAMVSGVTREEFMEALS